ncbi:MAG TPA: type II CRISPR RNA-guided endonuclease Cas9 [Candidatus Hydrogenedens sp.]|nr:type II CRISPR RNA-guided endonuclease Cas9 [Candidatus Hydrogenedens sp.]
MSELNHYSPYLLGLDLGSNSIGWALIKLDNDDNPCGIERVGVRVFEAGMEGQYESGKEESRNKKRRDARLVRRQIERRARRYRKLANVLQQIKLLPEGNMNDSLERKNIIDNLDKELRKMYIKEDLPEYEKNRLNQIFLYYLRSLAVEQKLEPYALGRVLYHLGQRRGFLSNRRGQKKDDEEKGKVKEGIAEIRKEMACLGTRTLGEYFAKIDPIAQQKRIRGRWTARDMYEQEFYAIWDYQAQFYPDILNDENKKSVFKAIFYQRPLKSQKEKIGFCQFECIARGAQRNRRRAPWVILKAQRFRLLQRVNDLEIKEDKLNKRPLTVEERRLLIDYLEKNGDATFAQLRKILGLPKTVKFNLEEGGEKKIPGNRTASAIREVIGERWDNMSTEERDKLVEDIYSIVNNKALEKRLIKHWKFSEDEALQISEIKIEDSYCNLSRQAIDKFLPGLEEGRRYGELVKEIYGMDNVRDEFKVDLLPPLEEAPIGEIRNPTVTRTLAEMRKIVNELVKRYGKPRFIRIESAKDLRNTKKEREKIWKNNRDLEEVRSKIRQKLINQGIPNPTRSDIEKYMLAEECSWVCPYTGRSISFTALFGSEPQFDIEHIIPLSRCLDDSFKNKTLCYHEENRTRKHNKTPFEAYAYDENQWEQILSRVEKFNSHFSEEKLRRFKLHGKALEDFIDKFSSAQLNDTRYASREACMYCGLLYGSEYRKHIFTISGSVTSVIRRMWNLNRILGDAEKNRDDHRQHAIDAIVIAITSPAMVKRISEQAENIPTKERKNKKWWRFIEPPWPSMTEEAEEKVLSIIVSHRPERKVSGRLHEETNYSPPKLDKNGETVVHVRKSLSNISKGEIDDIVDPVVRKAVQDKLIELGGDPKKAFADPMNYPLMPNKKGLQIPIKSVRIKKKVPVFPVGEKERVRYVTSDENHHIEIFETKDKKGRTKWEGYVVSMYEAIQRRKRGESILIKKLIREDGSVDENAKFLFSLCKKDMVQMKGSDGKEGYYLIIGIGLSNNNIKIRFKPHYKAKVEQYELKGLIKEPNVLKETNIKKVAITPIGIIQPAND